MGSFEDALADVARGRLTVAEAEHLLRQRATFSFGTNPAYVNWREPLSVDCEVPLTADDVRRALGGYLDGTWSADDLQRWAEFITMVGGYAIVPPAPSDDEDYYEDFWTVIHDLGTPAVFGAISPDSVRAKLLVLDRYEAA